MTKWTKRLKPLQPFLVLFFALIASRLLYSHFVHVDIRGDAGSYLTAAMNLANRGFLGIGNVPDYSRPPLYSILLAGFTKLGFGFNYWTYVILNCIFDTISLLLLLAIGRRIAPASSNLGLFLVAISPMWFVHVNSPITEPISILTFLGFFERWTREKRTRKDEIIAGLCLGLLTLCRAMFLWFPVAVILFEAIHFKAPKGMKLERGRMLSFLVAGFAAPVIWGLRNYAVTGTFAMTQDSYTAIMMAWYVVKLPLLDWRMDEHLQWIQNHPYSAALWGSNDTSHLGDIRAIMKAEIIDFIKNDPLGYIGNLLPKTLRLWVNGWWNPFNYAYSPRNFGATYIWSFAIPMLCFGLIGLLQHWGSKFRLEAAIAVAQWRAARIQILLVLYITALTLPFTVDARYSVIAYVTFSLWAGAGMLALFSEKRQ